MFTTINEFFEVEELRKQISKETGINLKHIIVDFYNDKEVKYRVSGKDSVANYGTKIYKRK
jgi:hypothetical protein